MTFSVAWPDGRVQECYSPSLVMHDHLEVGTPYSVAEFTERCVRALQVASDRVQARYGFACTSAAASTADILRCAAHYAPTQRVTVVRMHPPLPAESVSS